ncbi:16S rRNA (cytosine(1402)-N(4))-methyltransferase RsmH [Bdellovibrionales bacterium]|nr:16S rRNA (cytosine(1402)-N(4))-methyltransferase RsmH [Bdellovibrionales bacterium]
MEHIPVLYDEVLANITNSHSGPVRWVLDGTFGRGGHAKGILEKFPEASLIGVDRDEEAIRYGEEHFGVEINQGRLHLLRGNYAEIDEMASELERVTGGSGFDLILLDLGVSSPQLDSARRGFSFYNDGPLDMRMDQRESVTAAEIVNSWSSERLSNLFYNLGEIRRPNLVVKHIVERRRERPFERTMDLSLLIEQLEGWSRKGHHPATNYFMALRIEVNRELEQVEKMIEPLVNRLNDFGRMLVITFHSSEDRIVKFGFRNLKDNGVGSLVNKKVIQAQWPEKKRNPRARSAKLRIFERGAAGEA